MIEYAVRLVEGTMDVMAACDEEKCREGERGGGGLAKRVGPRKRAKHLLKIVQNRFLLGNAGKTSCSEYLAVKWAFFYLSIESCDCPNY